jgi:D-glycero-alpha-D-manno-heptose-7-phosphate kinase
VNTAQERPIDGRLDGNVATMIISRTPLRISIGGGGTDLPSYYSNAGGHVISAAIDKYIYIAINDTFTNDYFLKYSQLERVDRRDEIQHPLIREALTVLEIEPSVEIISMADIPAGTGLGSSGAFTVGLLKALYAHRREHVPAQHLAELACHIEIDRLGEPVGKQDQFIAAFGGLTSFRFRKDGAVSAEALKLPPGCLDDLEHSLLLFFTGYSRSSGSILQDQATRSSEGDAAMRRNLDDTLELGYQIKSALEAGEPDAYGDLLNEHWQRKRKRSPGMSNPLIDELYQFGLDKGATGGKLVGAGAGGFLLFYAHDAAPVRRAFRQRGLKEVVFRFDHDGAVLTART